MPELTRHDYEALLEAVEAWKVKDAHGEMMSMMMEGLLTHHAPDEVKNKLELEREQKMRAAEDAQKRRCERAILLSAKLIQMRDSASVNALCEQS